MDGILKVFVEGYQNYANYLWHEITHPSLHNYFYWLLLVSLFFLGIEWIRPWRADQPKFRKDFWLDAFYMFFNFFLFSLIIYNAASDVVVDLFNDGIIALTGFDLQAANPMRNWPMWAILLTGFVVRDFVQWLVHQLLHRSDRLWEFHKVHHSVEQMGFAAHLRFHWMETVVYRTIEYIPLALLGIGLYDFFVIHIFALVIGHYNHSNISVSGYVSALVPGLLLGVVFAFGYFDVALFNPSGWLETTAIVLITALATSVVLGPVMKYLFNSPEMHIWHHAYAFPEDRRYGMNFGLSLSIWDWLFGTAYVPHEGRDIKLGFPGMSDFPDHFAGQISYGLVQRGKPHPRLPDEAGEKAGMD
ncbi:MAG: sterol desaturase family protein [Saprospiraceae bacterium]|nr:sterol desaturase family protein [Saprospiraceae bacterium]